MVYACIQWYVVHPVYHGPCTPLYTRILSYRASQVCTGLAMYVGTSSWSTYMPVEVAPLVSISLFLQGVSIWIHPIWGCVRVPPQDGVCTCTWWLWVFPSGVCYRYIGCAVHVGGVIVVRHHSSGCVGVCVHVILGGCAHLGMCHIGYTCHLGCV